MFYFKKPLLFVALLFFSSIQLQAQPEKGKFINAALGIGLSSPDDDSEAGGSGFFAQAEYIVGVYKWLGIRPYAGIISTNRFNPTKNLDMMDYEVTTKAFFMGGKVRVLAPIPYVAPFLETGLGVSIGHFTTHTEFTNIERKGITSHIPFSVGLALGKHNNFDLAFTYQFHQSVHQYSGAAAIGYTFSLD